MMMGISFLALLVVGLVLLLIVGGSTAGIVALVVWLWRQANDAARTDSSARTSVEPRDSAAAAADFGEPAPEVDWRRTIGGVVLLAGLIALVVVTIARVRGLPLRPAAAISDNSRAVVRRMLIETPRSGFACATDGLRRQSDCSMV